MNPPVLLLELRQDLQILTHTAKLLKANSVSSIRAKMGQRRPRFGFENPHGAFNDRSGVSGAHHSQSRARQDVEEKAEQVANPSGYLKAWRIRDRAMFPSAQATSPGHSQPRQGGFMLTNHFRPLSWHPLALATPCRWWKSGQTWVATTEPIATLGRRRAGERASLCSLDIGCGCVCVGPLAGAAPKEKPRAFISIAGSPLPCRDATYFYKHDWHMSSHLTRIMTQFLF